jgi:hypothetical protein
MMQNTAIQTEPLSSLDLPEIFEVGVDIYRSIKARRIDRDFGLDYLRQLQCDDELQSLPGEYSLSRALDTVFVSQQPAKLDVKDLLLLNLPSKSVLGLTGIELQNIADACNEVMDGDEGPKTFARLCLFIGAVKEQNPLWGLSAAKAAEEIQRRATSLGQQAAKLAEQNPETLRNLERLVRYSITRKPN